MYSMHLYALRQTGCEVERHTESVDKVKGRQIHRKVRQGER